MHASRELGYDLYVGWLSRLDVLSANVSACEVIGLFSKGTSRAHSPQGLSILLPISDRESGD